MSPSASPTHRLPAWPLRPDPTAGTEGLVQTFKDVFTFWSVVAFEPEDSFGNADGAAIFGYFTYRSNALTRQ